MCVKIKVSYIQSTLGKLLTVEEELSPSSAFEGAIFPDLSGTFQNVPRGGYLVRGITESGDPVRGLLHLDEDAEVIAQDDTRIAWTSVLD
jgi:hypothetical protein